MWIGHLSETPVIMLKFAAAVLIAVTQASFQGEVAVRKEIYINGIKKEFVVLRGESRATVY